MELEGYSRPTCSKQARLVDCRISVVNKLDRRRRRRVLLKTRSTCRGEIFSKSGVWDKVPCGGKYTLIFGDSQISLQHSVGRKPPCQKPGSIRPVVSKQYRLVTDGRTHRRRQHIYGASIASRGKTWTIESDCLTHQQWVSSPVQYLGPPAYTERKCANTTDTVLVPWAGHLHSYNNKIYFFKNTRKQFYQTAVQHSETVMVWNYQNAGWSLKKIKLSCYI